MRSLALFLHFYQPPTQSSAVTQQVLQSCYIPLADLLLAHPEARFTLNISGALLEDINAIPDCAFAEKIKILLGRDQIELTNSAIYHPLLPSITSQEISTHLEINKAVLKDNFQTDPANVIFPPELAVTPEIVDALKGIVLIDESSINPKFDIDKIPDEQVFQLTNKNKTILVTSSRSIAELIRNFPGQLTAKIFINYLNRRTKENQIVVAGSDAEVFGHHYSERINFLKDLLETKQIKFLKITDVVKNVKTRHALSLPTIHPSSWQTTREDLKNDSPFSVWLDPKNPLQMKYYNLAQLTAKLLAKSPEPNLPAQLHYFRGVSSCHYYWLSNWPWWHPDLVESGARELIRCVRALYIDSDKKTPAEKLYHEFLLAMWSYHWSGEVEKKYQKFDNYRKKLLGSLPVK